MEQWMAEVSCTDTYTSVVGGPVIRHLACLDAAYVLHEQFVMALHLFGRLPSNGAGDLVPAIGRVLVVNRERLLERLVLLCGPRGTHRAGRHLREDRGAWKVSPVAEDRYGKGPLLISLLVGLRYGWSQPSKRTRMARVMVEVGEFTNV